MSKNKQQPQGGNVVDMPKKCHSEGCSKKDSRFNFCEDHYIWFKEGLITKEGIKVLDFDKKLQALQRRAIKSA